MAYSVKRSMTVKLDVTPSLAPQNLSCDGGRLMYMHKDIACIVSTSGLDTKQTATVTRVSLPSQFGVTAVTQAALVQVCGKQLLCLTARPAFIVVQVNSIDAASVKEFIAASSQGSTPGAATPAAGSVVPLTSVGPIVAYFKLADVGVPEERHSTEFFRGVAVVPEHDMLVVGTSWGEVLQFQASVHAGTAAVSLALTGRLQAGHKAAISSISANEKFIFSGDDVGSVAQWDVSSGKLLIRHDKGAGSPCTVLISRGDLCIGGFTSGHIRVYRAGLQEGGQRYMEVEASAHSRSVMSLDWSPAGPTFVSAGEDGLVNVWTLPEVGTGTGLTASSLPGSGTGPARLLLDMTARIPNGILTGACFVCPAGVIKGRPQGAVHVVVAAYDMYPLHMFLGLR